MELYREKGTAIRINNNNKKTGDNIKTKQRLIAVDADVYICVYTSIHSYEILLWISILIILINTNFVFNVISVPRKYQ